VRWNADLGGVLCDDVYDWRLDLGDAGMTAEDTPPPAVIEHWKRRIEEFKVKLEADPDNKIFAFWLSCYEGYVARFAKDEK